MSGAPDDTGFTADLQDKLTKISNSISASNRKFGGKGISCKASSTHPNNFGLGTLTLSKDFINDLRNNVAQFDNFYVFPALSNSASFWKQKVNGVYSDDYQNYLNSKFTSDSENYAVFDHTDNLLFCKFPSVSSNYGIICYIDSSSYKYLAYLAYNKSTYSIEKYYSTKAVFAMNSSMVYSSNSSLNRQSQYFLGRVGLSTIVFKSQNDALNYIRCLQGYSTPKIYISNKTVENDYTTTVNKLYDYSSHDTYTTINNNITQAITDKGSGLTDEEYQKIVDDVMKKVQTEIDSQPDSGDSGGSSGGGSDSGNTGGGSSGGDSGNTGGGESNTWLEKIYNRLGDILEKIGTVTGVDTLVSLVQQIADDIKTLKDGGTLSADLSDTNGLLRTLKSC